MSWLAVGQLIKVTIVKDQEGKYRLVKAQHARFVEDNMDESRESNEDGTQSEDDVELDTIIGRVYNYDYAVKLLIISKF